MFVPAEGNTVRADLTDLSPAQVQQLDGVLRAEGITPQWQGSSLLVDAAWEDRASSLVDQVRQSAPPPGAPSATPPAAGYPQAPTAYPAQPTPGYPQPAAYGAQPYGYAAAPATNSNATIALVCAALSWFMCPLVLAIVGVVFGRKAQREIAESGGTQGGEGLAKAAVIISWINIGFWLFFGLIYVVIVLIAILGSSASS
jgi:hypothetical protein